MEMENGKSLKDLMDAMSDPDLSIYDWETFHKATEELMWIIMEETSADKPISSHPAFGTYEVAGILLSKAEAEGWWENPNGMYMGHITDSGKRVVTTPDNQELNPRFDLACHSPDGFNWGYTGSGPAQLALAILAHRYNDDIALRHYQAFKCACIATLKDSWALKARNIDNWVKNELNHERKQERKD